MSETQWVCSKWNTKPTDADKWKVVLDLMLSDYYHAKDSSGKVAQLLKTEYLPCHAPKQYERVEANISEPDSLRYQDIYCALEKCGTLKVKPGYRIVSLVVERPCQITASDGVREF